MSASGTKRGRILVAVGAVALAAGIAVAIIVASGGSPPAEPFVEPTGVALGEARFTTLQCSRCHGEEGVGGVEMANYVGGSPPSLQLLAERMFVFEREDADVLIAALESGSDLEALRSDPPFRSFVRFLAQLVAVRDVITNGRVAGPVDPELELPENMPEWGEILTPTEVDAVIAYLLTLYPWEEDV